MLESLHVKNYVLIDQLDLDFQEGFSCITGETGSGKTIIMGALSLLLGQKADKEAVRNGSDSAEISGVFVTDESLVKDWLREHDIDSESGEILIRRVIKINGRSSYSINGSPVTRTLGEELGHLLVDVSSQHAHQTLMNPETLRTVVDEASCTEKSLNDFALVFSKLKSEEKKLSELEELVRKSVEEADYMRFCLGELEAAELKEGEEEELKRDIEIMSSSEYLRDNLGSAQDELRAAESSVSSALASLRKAEKKDPRLLEYSERLESQTIELDDIFTSLRDYISAISYSDYELNEKNSRLSQIQRIKRRFGGSVEEAIKRRDDYKDKLQKCEDSEEIIEKLNKQLEKLRSEAQSLADKLSNDRKKGAKKLSKQIEDNLHKLGMKAAVFSIDVERLEEMTQFGQDRIVFRIAANKGEKVSDIKDSSSGGELSRIMLAIKVSLKSAGKVGTMIFDEIDSGLGGVVANSVSEELKKLSLDNQVIAITHLPQLAVKADSHYIVYKVEKGGRTISNIRRIDGEDRVKEIARLLSGETSDISLEHARSLLEV